MGKKIKAIILKFPGTNNDVETARALKIVGAEPDILPVSLLSKKIILNYSLLVLAGGFSYGDYVYAGKLAALELKKKLNDTIFEFAEKDRFILGICNGFQILLELNILPEGFLAQNKNKHFISFCQPFGHRFQNDRQLVYMRYSIASYLQANIKGFNYVLSRFR